MNKYLRHALETVLRDAQTCSVDEHGFVQHMDSTHLAVLVVEYDKYCKKNGYPRIRGSASTTPARETVPK